MAESETIAKKPSGGLFKAASLIAMVTLISKLMGLVRDQMIAHGYGADIVSDAYNYAFQIPSFFIVLLGGLGGPFQTATVSILSKRLSGDSAPDAESQTLVNTFITVTGLIAGILSLLVAVFAPQVIHVIASQAPPELQRIAAIHLQWMSPMICLGALIGIFYGIANVYHQFFWSSFSPSAINIILILWILILGPDPLGYALCIATLMGGGLQILLQLPDFWKAGFHYRPAFHIHHPDFKKLAQLLFPASIGTTIGQLNIYVAMFFISQLPPGGWTAMNIGNRLIQFPIGILMTAMLIPLFPRLARWAHENKPTELIAGFRQSLQTLWMVSIPVIVVIGLLSLPIVKVLFQRGAFDAEDSQMVALILMVLALSMLPYMLRDGVTRIFYAYNDSRTPLIAGLVSIGINAGLTAWLIGPFGVAGVAMAQVGVSFANAMILSVLVRRYVPAFSAWQLLDCLLILVPVGLVSGGLGWLTLWGLGQVGVSGLMGSLMSIFGCLLVVFGSYGLGLLLVRYPLAKQFAQQLRNR